MPQRVEPTLDYVVLAEVLTALGNPVRLELLHHLRVPQTLGEIRLRPHRPHSGLSADRTLARQTVQQHLDRLVEHGLVAVEPTTRGGRELPAYLVNPARLFAFVEGLRALSTIHAGTGPAGMGTEPLGVSTVAPPAEGPRLVLVHGVYEGKVFRLDGPDAVWTIGRAAGSDIRLDYDPFVSASHATVERTEGRFRLKDLGARNPTSVNWRPLAPDTPTPLRAGDVIGIGKSYLVMADG